MVVAWTRVVRAVVVRLLAGKVMVLEAALLVEGTMVELEVRVDDTEPEPEPEGEPEAPPEIWKGNEYWKTLVSSSQKIWMP